MRVNTEERGKIKVLYNAYRNRVGPPLFVFWRATQRFYIAPNRPYGAPLPQVVLDAKELRGDAEMVFREGWNMSQEDGFAYAEIDTADWPDGTYRVTLLIHNGVDVLPGEFDTAAVDVTSEALEASQNASVPSTPSLSPVA